MANTRLGMVGRSVAGFGLGLAVLVLVAVPPAAASPAPNNCDGTRTVAVDFLALSPAQNSTMMAQTDGSYARTLRARAYCQEGANDLGEVTDAKIAVWIAAKPGIDVLVNGELATDAANPVVLFAANGFVDITISSTDPDILNIANGQWKATVGRHHFTVVEAFGSSIPTFAQPHTDAALWAQTPELGSLALFGAGAAGMAGYALTRLRAGFGRRGRRE
jgi:hypothetical protein